MKVFYCIILLKKGPLIDTVFLDELISLAYITYHTLLGMGSLKGHVGPELVDL